MLFKTFTSLSLFFFGVVSQETLIPFKYTELPIGQVRPLGWVKDQLELSANGFPGHMYDFYYMVTNSTWLGGTYEYNELHEAAPYWYNGLVPLAYILDDGRLINQVNHFLNHVIATQGEDGWLGPEQDPHERGLWARFLLLQGMMHHIIADPSQTDKILDAIYRFVELSLTMLRNDYEGFIQHEGDTFDVGGFGASRAHEYSTTLMWLYEHHPRGKQAMIWEVMELMWSGATIAKKDWTEHFVDGVFPKKKRYSTTLDHGVNVAEALRYTAQKYRMTKDPGLITKARDATLMTFRYHGAPSGTIKGDEGVSGQEANRGSELCMAVEVIFSESYLYRLFGENVYADQAEMATFNALPAQISADWWSHTYIAQPNQAWARDIGSGGPFWFVRSNGMVFGQESNYPCCSVNHPQALPKFLLSAFTRRAAGGLLHQYPVPLTATTEVEGGTTTVTVDTKYPFGNTIKYKITSTTPYNLYVRIPWWANADSYSISNDKKVPLKRNSDNQYVFAVRKGSSAFTLHFGTSPRIVHRERNTVSIYYGALFFALDIPYSTTTRPARFFNNTAEIQPPNTHPHSHDHELSPTGPWAVAIDPSQIKVYDSSESEGPLANPIYDRNAPPVYFTVPAVNITWGVGQGVAALPPNPVQMLGEPFVVRLVPYGSAKIHMAELPVVDLPPMEGL